MFSTKLSGFHHLDGSSPMMFWTSCTHATPFKDLIPCTGRAVSLLRLLAGAAPNDQELTALVGELTLKSPEFARRWAKHPVQNCMSGKKMMQHPLVGTLELNFEVLAQPDESGHRILMYTANERNPAAAGLRLLATTPEPATPINETAHLFP